MNKIDFPLHPDMPSIGGIISFVVVAAAIAIGLGCYQIVPPGHRGISVTLGKVDPIQFPEGLTFKWPFITKVINFPIMQLKADGKAESFSSDLQNLTVSFAVLYKVPEKQVVPLYQNYRGEPYMNIIEPRVQEVVKQVSALYRAEEMVKNREKVKEQVLERIRQSVGEILYIADILVTNIDLSDQLEAAIEQKVVREQEAFAKSYELDKERRQAEITIVRAEAEAKAVKIKGEALKASPEMIQFEIAQRWDGKAPLSVAVDQAGANILLPIK